MHARSETDRVKRRLIFRQYVRIVQGSSTKHRGRCACVGLFLWALDIASPRLKKAGYRLTISARGGGRGTTSVKSARIVPADRRSLLLGLLHAVLGRDRSGRSAGVRSGWLLHRISRTRGMHAAPSQATSCISKEHRCRDPVQPHLYRALRLGRQDLSGPLRGHRATRMAWERMQNVMDGRNARGAKKRRRDYSDRLPRPRLRRGRDVQPAERGAGAPPRDRAASERRQILSWGRKRAAYGNRDRRRSR